MRTKIGSISSAPIGYKRFQTSRPGAARDLTFRIDWGNLSTSFDEHVKPITYIPWPSYYPLHLRLLETCQAGIDDPAVRFEARYGIQCNTKNDDIVHTLLQTPASRSI